MIDASRWLVLEAWMALGLHVRWALTFETNNSDSNSWLSDDETGLRYRYEGHREWSVIRPTDRYRAVGYPVNDVPTLGYETMRHELAHYMVAGEERREKRNFGLLMSQAPPEDDEQERITLLAEQVIDALTRGATRIVHSISQPVRPMARI